mmetsp:Transcript_29968/g.95765  ORF Transcript_29968/g.95765 Transcript_29968/m.95765 type:complete len:166 (-) Transcript_29968:109-606(-)|eukprot:CAMPEP_0118876954 /NCGR_PEP_ID=MMETSP1163-20130328/17438_1 /TAXON_ID=124430 /ORGANISM="Phaeomonas parva, Strain CCMP2877" /LENGTH=165 /DNA_ID=CAMNT_0006812617 /DNA_START=111 /DNA_END=608 /DNA_ORIENTATION=+
MAFVFRAALILALAVATSAFQRQPPRRATLVRRTAAAEPVPEYGLIQHAGVLVTKVEESKAFYMDVLGFEDESHLRPTKLPYPGAFMRVAEGQQIHLMELPSVDPKTGRPAHGGRDRHLAMTIKSIEPLKQRLEANGIDYTMSQSGRAALFCRDPDGNAFEFMEV